MSDTDNDSQNLQIIEIQPLDTDSENDGGDDYGHMQMEMFVSATTEKTTNTIHLYDIAPKFTYDRKERDVSESAFNLRAMKNGTDDSEVEVQAARIKREDGLEVLVFPGTREECIEDSLRKLATSGNGVFLNGEAGVRFSLYELKQDLDMHKHTYSWPQLREGLYVLRRSGLRITNRKTGESWEEGFLSRLVEGGQQEGEPFKLWYASFHKLVTKSITDLTYRQMNYPRLMSITGQLAKYIFKRMVSVYTFADLEKPYQPTLTQIMQESGRGMAPEMKNNIKAMNRALDQLKDSGAIQYWEETKRVKVGRKVTNIHYNIYPTKKLVNEIIEANKQQKALRASMQKAQMRQLKNMISENR